MTIEQALGWFSFSTVMCHRMTHYYIISIVKLLQKSCTMCGNILCPWLMVNTNTIGTPVHPDMIYVCIHSHILIIIKIKTVILWHMAVEKLNHTLFKFWKL